MNTDNNELSIINNKTKYDYEYETLEDGSSRLSCVSIYNSIEYENGIFTENNSEIIYTYEEYDKVTKEIKLYDDIYKHSRIKEIRTYDKSTGELIQFDKYSNDKLIRSAEYLNVKVDGEAVRLSKVILHGVYKTIFSYDKNNKYRLTSEVFINTKTKATQIAIYEYDEFGNVKRRYGDSDNRLNFDAYYTYQPKNKIKTKMVKYSDGNFEFTEYNSKGDIVFYSNPSTKKTYCYTSDGKLIMYHETITKGNITVDTTETITYDSTKEEGYEYVTTKSQTIKFEYKKGKFCNTTSTETTVDKYKITEDNKRICVSSIGKHSYIYGCDTKYIYTLDDNDEVSSIELYDKNNGELLSTTVYNNSEFVKEIIEMNHAKQTKYIQSCTYDENHNLITKTEESKKLLDYFPA